MRVQGIDDRWTLDVWTDATRPDSAGIELAVKGVPKAATGLVSLTALVETVVSLWPEHVAAALATQQPGEVAGVYVDEAADLEVGAEVAVLTLEQDQRTSALFHARGALALEPGDDVDPEHLLTLARWIVDGDGLAAVRRDNLEELKREMGRPLFEKGQA